MDNVILKKAADYLEVAFAVVEKFPDEIKNEMTSAVEMIEPDTEENCKLLHDKLYEFWKKGTIYIDMKEISKDTGTEFETLMSLDEQSQLQISFEYSMYLAEKNPEKAFKSVYDNVHKALQVRELPDVAKLLGTDYEKLRIYPREVWEQLCGAYAMEYEENRDNSMLISELKEIIREAEENSNENND